MVQTRGVGVGVTFGLGVGVAVGEGVGVAVAAGVGVGEGVVTSVSAVGVGVGFGSATVGSGVPVTSGVGVGVATASGVGTGVAPDARSPTFRLTLGTASSKTLLSIVTSPEPVTSTSTASSKLFFSVIETWVLDLVIEPTVFQVRPRQSKPIVSTVLNVIPSGNGMVLVSMPPSPSRSIVTS